MAKKYKGFKGSTQAIEACHNKPKMSRKQQDAMLKGYAIALIGQKFGVEAAKLWLNTMKEG